MTDRDRDFVRGPADEAESSMNFEAPTVAEFAKMIESGRIRRVLDAAIPAKQVGRRTSSGSSA